MTRNDGLLLVAVLALAIVLVPATIGLAGQADGSVTVSTPNGESTLDLTTDGRFVFDGHLGEVIVVVEWGAARIVESPCPDRRCMDMGPVDGPGDVIVCAPGGIVLTAGGGPEVDDVVR